MSLATPWLIVDAEVALWPAWKDGMPYHGPGVGRDRPAALLYCKTTLTITETFAEGAVTGHGWSGGSMASGSSWLISIDFPDGAMSDEWSRLMSRAHWGGYRILTVRFFDESTGHWSLLSFFYVAPATDAVSESDQKMMRALTLRSSWLQETVGSAGLPSLDPVVVGEVDWVCGSQRITALNYNPVTETWTSLPRNVCGTGLRYVTLTPIDEEADSDVVLSYYLPRVTDATVVEPLLPTSRVLWQNTLALRVGNQDSANHHGLTLTGGHVLQDVGIVEPLIKLPQDRVLDEPVLVFRYLRRVYATLGHGVFAVPRLVPNEDPLVTHDPAFRIAVPGPANPATGQSGLVLLPNGAWLDGTLVES